WSVDLAPAHPTDYDAVSGMTDLGDGKIAFTFGCYQCDPGGLYVIEGTNGRVAWTKPSYQVLGSNGAGLLLVDLAASPYEKMADLAVLDSSGREVWREPSVDGYFLAWTSAKLWLGNSQNQGICSTTKYTAARGLF